MDVDDVLPSELSLCSTFSPDSLRTIVKRGVSLTWTSLTIWARPCCSATGSHSLVRAFYRVTAALLWRTPWDYLDLCFLPSGWLLV